MKVFCPTGTCAYFYGMRAPVAMTECAVWLKENTRPDHEQAETVMMPLIQKATTPELYGALLQRFYGLYQPLEQLAKPFLWGSPFSTFVSPRTSLLAADLQTLGFIPQAEKSIQLPTVTNYYEALGLTYVLEGAALGGRIIAKMLQVHPSLPQDAFRFFRGNEERTGAHWQLFTTLLNTEVQTPQQMQQACNTARATFKAHTRWMQTR